MVISSRSWHRTHDDGNVSLNHGLCLFVLVLAVVCLHGFLTFAALFGVFT